MYDSTFHPVEKKEKEKKEKNMVRAPPN